MAKVNFMDIAAYLSQETLIYGLNRSMGPQEISQLEKVDLNFGDKIRVKASKNELVVSDLEGNYTLRIKKVSSGSRLFKVFVNLTLSKIKETLSQWQNWEGLIKTINPFFIWQQIFNMLLYNQLITFIKKERKMMTWYEKVVSALTDSLDIKIGQKDGKDMNFVYAFNGHRAIFRLNKPNNNGEAYMYPKNFPENYVKITKEYIGYLAEDSSRRFILPVINILENAGVVGSAMSSLAFAVHKYCKPAIWEKAIEEGQNFYYPRIGTELSVRIKYEVRSPKRGRDQFTVTSGGICLTLEDWDFYPQRDYEISIPARLINQKVDYRNDLDHLLAIATITEGLYGSRYRKML